MTFHTGGGTTLNSSESTATGTTLGTPYRSKDFGTDTYEAQFVGLPSDRELSNWFDQSSSSQTKTHINTWLATASLGDKLLVVFIALSILSTVFLVLSVISSSPPLSLKLSGFIFIGVFGLTLELLYSKKLTDA